MDLKKFRKQNGISQQELASYLGVGQSFISQVESGRSPLPESVFEKIKSNPDWTIYVDTVENKGEITIKTDAPEQEKDGRIPLVPFEAVAGPGTMVFSDEQIEDYYMVREFKSADFLIRVNGDSMSPKYIGGDLVACKAINDVLFFQFGRVYVLYTKSQGVMIKRVQPSKKEDCILCVSENEKYAPFDVPKEDITSVALVCGSISLE